MSKSEQFEAERFDLGKDAKHHRRSLSKPPSAVWLRFNSRLSTRSITTNACGQGYMALHHERWAERFTTATTAESPGSDDDTSSTH